MLSATMSVVAMVQLQIDDDGDGDGDAGDGAGAGAGAAGGGGGVGVGGSGRGGRGGSRRGGGPGGGRGRGAHDAKRRFQGRDHVFTRWNWNAYERLVGISTTQSSYPFLSPAPISITVASLFPHAMAASSALLSRVAWEPKGVTNSIKKLHVPFCCFS